MVSTSFRLYGETLWISPYVFSSFVALQEKGVPFDVAELSLMDGDNKEPAYRDTSITARVPMLEHEGFRLTESSAIAEYLEELFPAPAYPRLLPESLRERARARQVMAFLRSDLATLREERPTVTMFYRFRLPPLGAQAARDAAKLLHAAELLIPREDGPLFGAWSLADAELAFMLHRLILSHEPMSPRVRAYAAAEWQRPSARAYLDHARPPTVPEGYWAYSGLRRPEAAEPEGEPSG